MAKPDYNHYRKMSKLELANTALFWREDIWVEEKPISLDTNKIIWSFNPVYPLDKLGKKEDWIEWFRKEQIMWSKEGQPNRYDNMLNTQIEEAIVVVEYDNNSYLWDGNHRTGASFLNNFKNIPTIVGIFNKN